MGCQLAAGAQVTDRRPPGLSGPEYHRGCERMAKGGGLSAVQLEKYV